MKRRSEQFKEYAFLATAWPPCFIVDLLMSSKKAPGEGLCWAALLGVLLLPITGVVAIPLLLAGIVTSWFEKDKS